MTEIGSPTRSSAREWEARAEQLGRRSGSFMERLGFSRIAGGILLILVGVLVITLPNLIVWIVGVGAIVLGVLILVSEPTLSARG